MPMPSPAVGGMPYSMAMRKSSSTSAASRSPAAFFAAYTIVRESCLVRRLYNSESVMVNSTGRPLPSSPPIQYYYQEIYILYNSTVRRDMLVVLARISWSICVRRHVQPDTTKRLRPHPSCPHAYDTYILSASARTLLARLRTTHI